MKVCLDNIVFNLQRAGGISTYWGELCKRILNSTIDVSFVDKPNQNIVRNSLHIPEKLILKSGTGLDLLDRFFSLPLKSMDEKFIFHSSYSRTTSNKRAMQVCTIHDFIHEKYYDGLRKRIHSYQKGKAIRTAEELITVSENTRQDLLNYFPQINPNNVHVIYNGVSDDFFPLPDKAHPGPPYILFIGSREPYKNFDFAIRLLSELKGFELFIVGSPLNTHELTLLNKFIPSRWKIFNNIDNAKLNEIYNYAYALLYPSSYEGFGLPLIEAMKAGTPFIALNSSSIPEVAANAGILLNELDIELFKSAVISVDANRVNLVENGIQRATEFSWDKCYKGTIEVYKKLLER